MRFISLLGAMVLAGFLSSSFAKIDCKIVFGSEPWDTMRRAKIDSVKAAGGDTTGNNPIFNVSDSLGYFGNWGANQYRYSGMRHIREGVVHSTPICLSNISHTASQMAVRAGNADNGGSFLCYGVCNTFNVPVTGEYKIRSEFNVFAFLFIDGKEIVFKDTLALYPGLPGCVIGTYTQTGTTNYKRGYNMVNLTQGVHKLEFYCSAADDRTYARFKLWWTLPNETTESVIPISAFGGDTCDFDKPVISVRDNNLSQNVIRNFSLNGNTLTIPNTNNDNISVAMYNTSGKKVVAVNKATVNLGTLNLKTGIYTVNILRNGIKIGTTKYIQK